MGEIIDSSAFSPQSGDATQPTPDPSSHSNLENLKRLSIALVASGAACILGAIGTWATVFGGYGSIAGTTTDDGKFTLLAGVLATSAGTILLVKKTWPRAISAITFICGAGVLAVFVIDGKDIFGKQIDESNEWFGDVDLLAPGWGLWLLGASAVALLVVSALVFLAARRDFREPVVPDSTSGRATLATIGLIAIVAFLVTASGVLPTSEAVSSDSTNASADAAESSGDDSAALEESDVSEPETELPDGEYKSVSQGETLVIPGEYHLKVKDVETASTISSGDDFSEPSDAKGKWVVVNLSIRNGTGSETTFYSSDFIKLLDEDGTEYTTSGGNGDDQVLSLKNYLDGRDLQPKLWENGNVAFDVPKSAKIKSAQIIETLETFADEDTPTSFVEFDRTVR